MLENFSLENILENMTMGVVLVDSDDNLIYMNQLVTEITGYEIEDVDTLEKCFQVVFPYPEERQNIENIFDEKLKNDGHYNAVFPIKTQYGGIKYLEFRVNLLEDNYLLINMVNVSERVAQARELKETKERLENAVEAADIGIWDWNIKTGEFLYSDHGAEMLGFDKEELDAEFSIWENLVYEEDRELIENKLAEHFNGETDTYICEHRIKTKSGGSIWVRSIGRVVEVDQEGNPFRTIGVHINIDEYKKREKEIEFLSFHDELTGLYNRRYLENEFERISDSRKYPISFIIGDIDNLKEVNDTFGHRTGDEYIINSAWILESVVRNEDIVARTGGDEFAILLPDTDRLSSVKVCERIRRKFRDYNTHAPKDFAREFSISLGSCTLESSEDDLSICYNIADQRMYDNKVRKYGVNEYNFFKQSEK